MTCITEVPFYLVIKLQKIWLYIVIMVGHLCEHWFCASEERERKKEREIILTALLVNRTRVFGKPQLAPSGGRIRTAGGPYGKSAKFRLVPLNPHSQKALDAYVIARSRMVRELTLETRTLSDLSPQINWSSGERKFMGSE